jgi:hypothetical protein
VGLERLGHVSIGLGVLVASLVDPFFVRREEIS